MKHLHFEEINSTQSYLKENIQSLILSDQHILISCNRQTSGYGSKDNAWIHHSNSLAVSFTLKPNSQLTLSTIELGLICLSFLKRKTQHEFFLKWPNDLVSLDGKKCGGMISQFVNPEVLIFGVGINLNLENLAQSNEYRYGIDSAHFNFDNLKELSEEFYNFVLSNRIHDTEELINKFNSQCIHYNKSIKFSDDQQNFEGIFKGIDKDGRALIEINSEIKSFISGSVTLIN